MNEKTIQGKLKEFQDLAKSIKTDQILMDKFSRAVANYVRKVLQESSPSYKQNDLLLDRLYKFINESISFVSNVEKGLPAKRKYFRQVTNNFEKTYGFDLSGVEEVQKYVKRKNQKRNLAGYVEKIDMGLFKSTIISDLMAAVIGQVKNHTKVGIKYNPQKRETLVSGLSDFIDMVEKQIAAVGSTDPQTKSDIMDRLIKAHNGSVSGTYSADEKKLNVLIRHALMRWTTSEEYFSVAQQIHNYLFYVEKSYFVWVYFYLFCYYINKIEKAKDILLKMEGNESASAKREIREINRKTTQLYKSLTDWFNNFRTNCDNIMSSQHDTIQENIFNNDEIVKAFENFVQFLQNDSFNTIGKKTLEYFDLYFGEDAQNFVLMSLAGFEKFVTGERTLEKDPNFDSTYLTVRMRRELFSQFVIYSVNKERSGGAGSNFEQLDAVLFSGVQKIADFRNRYARFQSVLQMHLDSYIQKQEPSIKVVAEGVQEIKLALAALLKYREAGEPTNEVLGTYVRVLAQNAYALDLYLQKIVNVNNAYFSTGVLGRLLAKLTAEQTKQSAEQAALSSIFDADYFVIENERKLQSSCWLQPSIKQISGRFSKKVISLEKLVKGKEIDQQRVEALANQAQQIAQEITDGEFAKMFQLIMSHLGVANTSFVSVLRDLEKKDGVETNVINNEIYAIIENIQEDITDLAVPVKSQSSVDLKPAIARYFLQNEMFVHKLKASRSGEPGDILDLFRYMKKQIVKVILDNFYNIEDMSVVDNYDVSNKSIGKVLQGVAGPLNIDISSILQKSEYKLSDLSNNGAAKEFVDEEVFYVFDKVFYNYVVEPSDFGSDEVGETGEQKKGLSKDDLFVKYTNQIYKLLDMLSEGLLKLDNKDIRAAQNSVELYLASTESAPEDDTKPVSKRDSDAPMSSSILRVCNTLAPVYSKFALMTLNKIRARVKSAPKRKAKPDSKKGG
jgi:hypothetical protein